jgi:hypothetical protein
VTTGGSCATTMSLTVLESTRVWGISWAARAGSTSRGRWEVRVPGAHGGCPHSAHRHHRRRRRQAGCGPELPSSCPLSFWILVFVLARVSPPPHTSVEQEEQLTISDERHVLRVQQTFRRTRRSLASLTTTTQLPSNASNSKERPQPSPRLEVDKASIALSRTNRQTRSRYRMSAAAASILSSSPLHDSEFRLPLLFISAFRQLASFIYQYHPQASMLNITSLGSLHLQRTWHRAPREPHVFGFSRIASTGLEPA